MISLTNPTTEVLQFVPTISNANNFSLERDDQRPILIRPGDTLQVPLNFMPSALGPADHKAKITFHSEEVCIELAKCLTYVTIFSILMHTSYECV